MRFGKTLRESTYLPWQEYYIDYAKLKTILREDKKHDDSAWTDADETRFTQELFNVQLKKVSDFQKERFDNLKERAESAFGKLKDLAPSDDQPKSDITTARLKECKEELDGITKEVEELKRYSSANFTGFLKITKKHDRKRGQDYKLRPIVTLQLTKHGLNSEEAYSPLLKKLSTMYYIINCHLEGGDQSQAPDLEHQEEVHDGARYTAHKFWVHHDNLLEVKTSILRHLPALVYSEQSAKELDGNDSPSITSLYFDSPRFELYSTKVERQVDASSLRLRWFGQLSAKPEILLEQKITHENGTSEEKQFTIKDKYVKGFVDSEYKMEKSILKMERQGYKPDQIDAFKSTVDAIQEFVVRNKLEPVVRANYTRTAFQKPADDRVRISIDSNIAFIREDTLDLDRPCRDPQSWHRTDVDNSNMTFPFENINKSEVSKFPHSLLEIKLKEDGSRKRPAWIEDLMGSHLVHSAPRFSKFVHGVASLFEDYVNNLPFWLNDLEEENTILKDPHTAFEEENQRKAQQAENEQVVGSFLGKATGSFKPAASLPLGRSYLSERATAEASPGNANGRGAEGDGEENGGANGTDGLSSPKYGTLSSVLPSFSMATYSRFKRGGGHPQLPDGVVEPKIWIKNMGPLQIEPKVWLANERTFLKWQHICVLLGSLAVSLYTAAGENFVAECMGVTYVVIAMLAGSWGYFMLRKRRNMILERSGKDFNNVAGPLVLSVALMVALVLNLIFAYRAAFERWDADANADAAVAGGNGTEQVLVGEL